MLGQVSGDALRWSTVWTRQDDGRPWLFSGYYLAPVTSLLGWQDCMRLRVVPWGQEGKAISFYGDGPRCEGDDYNALRPKRYGFAVAGGAWRHMFVSPGYGLPAVWDGYLYAGPDDIGPIVHNAHPGARVV